MWVALSAILDLRQNPVMCPWLNALLNHGKHACQYIDPTCGEPCDERILNDHPRGDSTMIMFGKMTFSAESAMIVAEAYGKLAPIPAFMKITGPYIRSGIEEGIATISIFEFDEAKADEAIDYLQKRYNSFAAIEGVHTELEEWLGVGAALQLLEETHSVTAALDAVSFRI
jgi:hypothetical protein